MALKQTEQRELKKAVLELVQNALVEKGYYSEMVEGGIALAVGKTGETVPSDFSQETYFFVIDAKFKKDFDLDEELDNYATKLKKAEEKANGTGKPKVSAKDLDIKSMTPEEMAELEKRLELAKGTAKKPESLKTKEDKAKEKAQTKADKKAEILKAVQEGAEQGEKEKAEEEKTQTQKA